MLTFIKKHKWLIIIFAGLIIFILGANDYEVEATLLGFFYFGTLFVLGTRWLIKELKFVNQLKNERYQSELMHLKSQVNPHFFFNMLNNLYGLVDKDTKKAKSLILQLSEMMRYSIYEGDKESVTLKEEINYLKNYIELHKMRYHKTINVEFIQEVNSEDQRITPLLLIMLLENAFKHGVENLRENAYVKIALTANDKQISFEVENNYDTSQLSESEGIGLNNLKRRLELIYPDKHQLDFQMTDGVYNAKLKLNLA